MRRQISSKSHTCTEGADVYAAGISVKVGAHYPGRSAACPCATGVERRREGSAEVSRGHSRSLRPDRRPEPEVREGVSISMHSGDAEGRAERPGAAWPGRGRNPREGGWCVKGHGKARSLRPGDGAVDGSGGRTREHASGLKAGEGNKGAAGVDGMTVDALLPYLGNTGRGSRKSCWRGGMRRARCGWWRYRSPEAACGPWDSHGAGPPHPTGVASGFAASI
jgi:hypothetical protein